MKTTTTTTTTCFESEICLLPSSLARHRVFLKWIYDDLFLNSKVFICQASIVSRKKTSYTPKKKWPVWSLFNNEWVEMAKEYCCWSRCYLRFWHKTKRTTTSILSPIKLCRAKSFRDYLFTKSMDVWTSEKVDRKKTKQILVHIRNKKG